MTYYYKYQKYKNLYQNIKNTYLGGFSKSLEEDTSSKNKYTQEGSLEEGNKSSHTTPSASKMFLSPYLPPPIGTNILEFLPSTTDITTDKKAPRIKKGTLEDCEKFGFKPYEKNCMNNKHFFNDDFNKIICCSDTFFDISNSNGTHTKLNYDKFFDCVSKLANFNSPHCARFFSEMTILQIFNHYFTNKEVPNYLAQSLNRNERQVLITEKLRTENDNRIETLEMLQAFGNYASTNNPRIIYKNINQIMNNQEDCRTLSLLIEESNFNLGLVLFHFCRMIFNLYNPIVPQGVEVKFFLVSYGGTLVRSEWNKEIWSLFWACYLLWLFHEDDNIDTDADISDSENYKDLYLIIDLFSEDIQKNEWPTFEMIYERLMEKSTIQIMAQLYFNKPY